MRRDAVALVAMVCVAGTAWGQLGVTPPAEPVKRGRQGAQPSQAQPAPGKTGQPGARAVALIRRTDQRTLQLTANVSLSFTLRELNTGAQVADGLAFQTAAMVFPMLQSSASHQIAASRFLRPSGELKLNGRAATEEFEILRGYPGGTQLAKWSLRDMSAQRVELEVKIPVLTYRTVFDEAAAKNVDWPASWPEEASSTFKPQLYVDFGARGPEDMTVVRELLKKWTAGKDPKSVKPAVLAKFLAGEVMKLVQISGNGLGAARTGEVEGFQLQGAVRTAELGRGSEFDAVCLLAAVYRMAGLPARTVIGYESSDARQRDEVFARVGAQRFRAWVEFALPDETTESKIAWIPVDIVRMRNASSQPPSLDRTWPWFGTHNELDQVVPIAFQFHPPTDVVAHGSPAFYGWMVTPAPPMNVTQAIRFTVFPPPRRAGETFEAITGEMTGGGPAAAPAAAPGKSGPGSSGSPAKPGAAPTKPAATPTKPGASPSSNPK